MHLRFAASSVILEDGRLWVVGGHDGYNELSSTEFISSDKAPILGPSLPFTISWHTMVRYDSEQVFIIAGKQEGNTTNKTWIGIINHLQNNSNYDCNWCIAYS